MEQRLLLVYNPNAGKGKMRQHLSGVVEALCHEGYVITVHATRAPKEATELVLAQGENYDVVVCAGGDGTINEVVTAVIQMEKKPIIGYVPTGTVNDFAGSLGLPKNPTKAAQVIVNGKVFACDIGRFNDRYFDYVAAFGAFTEVSYETPQKTKNAIGKMAYFMDAIRVLPSIRGIRLKMNADGQQYEGTYIYGMISNSKTVGGFKLEDKRHPIDLDDGKFELVLIKMPSNPYDLEQIATKLLLRDLGSEDFVSLRTSKVTFEFTEPIKWTLDGESGGLQQKVTIECCHKAVNIFAG